MVLSRKKLKEKLRTLLVDSTVNAECKSGVSNGEDVSKELESVRERLKDSSKPKVKRPRKKKKKKAPLLDDKNEDGEVEEEAEEEKEEEPNEDVNEREEKEKRAEEKKKKKQNRNKNEKKKKQKQEDQSKEKEIKIANETPTIENSTNSEKQSIELKQSDNLSLSEENSKKVYVGGIPYYSTEDDIKSFFESCGTISDIDCMKFPETGKFRGIAILTFKTEAASKRALNLDGSDMGGFYLKTQPYKGKNGNKSSNKPDFSPQIIQGYNRIYVGNLSWDIKEEDLKDFFQNLKIQSIRFGTDKSTGEFKGFVHVDFEENNSVLNALKLDQKMVKGRPVRIRCAVPIKNVKISDNNLEGNIVNLQEVEKKVENLEVKEVKEGQKKKKRRTCYECGMPGHLSSECPNKKNNLEGNNVIIQDQVENDSNNNIQGQEVQNKKKKRRTCYECGTPGHLSSECPNKIIINNHINNDIIMEEKEGKAIKKEEMENAQMQEASKKKKNKRRTCYECGIPGHLSSECPNKKT